MKRKIKSSYIIVLIIVVFIVCFRAYRHRLIKLPNAVPISITVTINPIFKSKASVFSINVKDPSKIYRFIKCLKTGKGNADHKCGDRGTIILNYESSKEIIKFLPGHNQKYYEIRYNRSNFRIKIKKFIEEFKNLGVLEDKIPWE